MSSDARKKEKHRLKRLKKKKEIRRVETISPFRRAGMFDGKLECYATAGYFEKGLGDFIVLGQVPGGSYVMACFLVDFWCVGLKDAWGRPVPSRHEFEETILDPWRERATLVRVEAKDVHRYVAGAIRFSHMNGFRLPPHWERFAAILGDLGDVRNTDLSGFGIDGGLRFVGEFDFLRRRLIGSTVEEFLSRPDVKYITSADSLEWEDEESEEDDEDSDPDAALDDWGIEALTGQVLKAAVLEIGKQDIRRWIEQNNVVPHPMLDEAIGIVSEAAGKLPTEVPDDRDSKTVFAQVISRIIDTRPVEVRKDLADAVEQFRQALIGSGDAEDDTAQVSRDIPAMVDAEWSREVSPDASTPADSNGLVT
jgi:hypothetical protein